MTCVASFLKMPSLGCGWCTEFRGGQVAEDDQGSTAVKDAMLEKQAMLKHMLAADKIIKEQQQLAEDAALEKQAMMQHMMAANENLQKVNLSFSS